MSDAFFIFTMTGIIMAEICIIAYLKYLEGAPRRVPAAPQTMPPHAANTAARYQGAERRARKRSSGALYRQAKGDWVFH